MKKSFFGSTVAEVPKIPKGFFLNSGFHCGETVPKVLNKRLLKYYFSIRC